VYENNDLQFYTEIVMTNERRFHFAMCSRIIRARAARFRRISWMIAEIENTW
jgi:hypothetical protein